MRQNVDSNNSRRGDHDSNYCVSCCPWPADGRFSQSTRRHTAALLKFSVVRGGNLPYAVIFAIAAACTVAVEFRPDRIKLLAPLALIPAVLLAGFRLDIGTDFANYARIFQGQIIFSKVAELGFVLFTWATNQFDSSGRLAFVLSSLLICLGYFRFAYRYSPAPLFAWCLALALPINFLASLNLVKAHMAIAIGLLAICEAKDRRMWGALPLLLIAGSFHYLAFLIAPLVVFEGVTEKWQPRIFWGTILVFAVAMLAAFLLPYCARYAYFVSGHTSANSELKALLFAAGAVCVGAWYVLRNGWRNLPTLMLMLYVMMVAFWAFTDTSNFFLRMSAVFAPFSIAAFSILPSRIPLRRAYLVAALIALGGLMTLTATRDNTLSPYQASLTIPSYAGACAGPATLMEMLTETSETTCEATATPTQIPQKSGGGWLGVLVSSFWLCRA